MPSQRPHSPYRANSSRRACRYCTAFWPLGQRVSSRSLASASGGTQERGISTGGGSCGCLPGLLMGGGMAAKGAGPRGDRLLLAGPAKARPSGLALPLPASSAVLECCRAEGLDASTDRNARELACSGPMPLPKRGVPPRPPIARCARATPPAVGAAGKLWPPVSWAAGAAVEGLGARGCGARGVPAGLQEASLLISGVERLPPVKPVSWLAPWPSRAAERRSDTLLPLV